jgi:pantoate--beta-alanine ligase
VQTSKGKTSWAQAQQTAKQIIESIPDSQLDYLELCDAETLQILTAWNEAGKAVCLVAVHVDGVRLIDNVVLP